MKQKISLFNVAIAFSIAGLCTSCSSDDPVDDTVEETDNQVGHLLMSSNWIMELFLPSHTPKVTVAIHRRTRGKSLSCD